MAIGMLDLLDMDDLVKILYLAKAYRILLEANQQEAAQGLAQAAAAMYMQEQFTAACEVSGMSVTWENGMPYLRTGESKVGLPGDKR